MDTHTLNLARKWRSKNFDQIIGQDLAVSMLKNSLFLNQYFPVYLFAGQKGCGKTSTARVFAAAVNCQNLPIFQKEPKSTVVPCLECHSCIALSKGAHPDFIEIDAASNTGVDNVRTIIDSSALLPLMGRKKIYLIDEAHMLSKAAFNAFLKLMEEPPLSVIFILATTDTQKIIETVRSRCFQLFFKPIEGNALVNYLTTICKHERIAYDEQGLDIIVKVTEGSARDALNLLEQVRFSHKQVTRQAVYNVLGYIDESRLLQLLEIILHKPALDLLKFTQEHALEKYSADFLWQQIVEMLRACIWIKNGVSPRYYGDFTAQLQFLSRSKSLAYLTRLLELFYTNEQLFRTTTAQYTFIEILLLRICQKNESNSNSNMPLMVGTSGSYEEDSELEAIDSEEPQEEIITDQMASLPAPGNDQHLWQLLVKQVELLHDPLLASLFKQGSLRAYRKENGLLQINFPQELIFFKETIESTQLQWQPLFSSLLEIPLTIEITFQGTSSVAAPAKPDIKKVLAPAVAPPAPVSMPKQSAGTYYSRPKSFIKEKALDVSDAQKWPTVNLILHYFPGTVTQIKDLA